MERVNQIIKHPVYQECRNKIETAEEGRIFCVHNMIHFLDVARLAMIIKLEKNLPIETELIYAAALLHDIGRNRQYEEGIPHELASAEIAPQILQECGFDEKETGVIIKAIKEHRTLESANQDTLSGIIYDADKMSRPCFACKAESECSWEKNRKNLMLIR